MNYTNLTDTELVDATLSGDNAAFEELVIRYQRLVLAAVYRYIGITGSHSSSVEDIVQESFVSAWIKLRMLREKEKFASWICGIAKNKAKNLVMRAHDDVSYDQLSAALGETFDFSDDDKGAAALHETIDTLPAPIRETVNLHYFEGYSVREIAEKLGIAEGTVKWRLSEGRNKLRKEYGMNMRNDNTALTENIMAKIKNLGHYFRHNNPDFRAEYDKIYNEIMGLPESKEKLELLLFVLFKGYFYANDLRTPETLARMKSLALELGDEESMIIIFAQERRFMDDAEVVKIIREEQLPFAEKQGWKELTHALEFEYAQALNECGEFDEAAAYFKQVTETAAKNSIEYGIAYEGIREIEEFRDIDKEKAFTSFGSYKFKYDNVKLTVDEYKCYNMYNFALQFYATCGINYNIDLVDHLLHDSSMKVGDCVASVVSPETTMTFAKYGVTVEWDNGVFDDCEEWQMRAVQPETVITTTVWWKRGVGVVKEEINRTGKNPEQSCIVLSKYDICGGDGIMPFAVGNKWLYRIDMGDEKYSGTTEYEVLDWDGTTANLGELAKIFIK